MDAQDNEAITFDDNHNYNEIIKLFNRTYLADSKILYNFYAFKKNKEAKITKQEVKTMENSTISIDIHDYIDDKTYMQ
jgi:hypothetical protein